MKKFILHSTIFCSFSEAFLINYVVDFKLFYLMIFVNLFLISVAVQITFSKKILLILLLLTLFGFLGVALGTDRVSRISSQVLGIFVVTLYYYNFFKYQNLSVENYFKIYANYAYFLCFVGLLMFLFNLITKFEIVPVKSLMLEPAHFVTAVLPACYYFYKNRGEANGILKFSVVLSSIILSFSSLGILGLMFGLLLVPKKINITKIIFISTLGVSIFIILLQSVPSFSLRVNDTYNSFINKDLESANLSSYALISNLFVAYESFKFNPISGGGIGSHVLSHEKFISLISGSETFGDMIDLNSQDANSLLIRVVSELGLMGVFLIFMFIFTYYPRGRDFNSVFISRSILIYFFAKLFREGHYFSPEMYFFVFLYAYNKYEFITFKKPNLVSEC